MSEYSSVLKLKLKITTSGTGMRPESGKGAAALIWQVWRLMTARLVGELQSAAQWAWLVLEIWGGESWRLSRWECYSRQTAIWQARAIAGGGDCEEGRSMCGTLRKSALTRIRNMDVCRGESARLSGPTSSFCVHEGSRGKFVLLCQLYLIRRPWQMLVWRHRPVFLPPVFSLCSFHELYGADVAIAWLWPWCSQCWIPRHWWAKIACNIFMEIYRSLLTCSRSKEWWALWQYCRENTDKTDCIHKQVQWSSLLADGTRWSMLPATHPQLLPRLMYIRSHSPCYGLFLVPSRATS